MGSQKELNFSKWNDSYVVLMLERMNAWIFIVTDGISPVVAPQAVAVICHHW